MSLENNAHAEQPDEERYPTWHSKEQLKTKE